ncbi:hypothetical protein EDB89DRAFT_1979598, partial [Lactarius sanguifluus]
MSLMQHYNVLCFTTFLLSPSFHFSPVLSARVRRKRCSRRSPYQRHSLACDSPRSWRTGRRVTRSVATGWGALGTCPTLRQSSSQGPCVLRGWCGRVTELIEGKILLKLPPALVSIKHSVYLWNTVLLLGSHCPAPLLHLHAVSSSRIYASTLDVDESAIPAARGPYDRTRFKPV